MIADAIDGESDGSGFRVIVSQRDIAKADKVLSRSSAKDCRR